MPLGRCPPITPATDSFPRVRPRRLLTRYAVGLTTAYLLTVAEVVAIVGALGGRGVVTVANIATLIAVVTVGTATVGLGAVAILRPSLRWLAAGRRPTPAEITTTAKIIRRQTAIMLAPWLLTAAVLVPLNLDADASVFVVITTTLLFGAIAAVCTGFLFTLRTLRPLMARVPPGERPAAPGVRARLILMWTLCTALPGGAIALLLILRYRNWLLTEDSPIELALLVLALVAVVLGLRAMLVVSMSISDPIGQVVAAMADVERGDIDGSVEVYEWSEIGRLQIGFNRMVAGLRERDRLHDLFGRHVGEEVARRALEQGESPAGDEREVAVLFVDLTDSTRLAVEREPHEVAGVLNDFFRIVVAEVDARHGLINKVPGRRRAGSVRRTAAHRRSRISRPRGGPHPRPPIDQSECRFRHRRVRRPGFRGQHRRGEPLRVHGDRRPRQRGGAAGRLRERPSRPGAGFRCGCRPGRPQRTGALGRRR